MWAELDFILNPDAESRLFGSQGRTERGFRKTLAALNTKYGIGLSSDFFGYTDEGIANPHGESTTAIGTTPRGLRLIATGSSACEHLSDRSGAIHAALMQEAMQILPMASRSGEHTAWLTPFGRPFFIKALMVGKTKGDNFWFQAARAVQNGSTWLKEADRKLPNVIGRSLMRQAVFLAKEGDELEGNVAELLGKSIAGGRHWNETGTEFGQRLGIKMHAVGDHTYVRHGPVGLRVMLKNVEFTMRGDFGGPWFVGRLKIEGQGQLLPATGAWCQRAEAA